MAFRDIKRFARQALHNAMRVSARCYTDGPAGPFTDLHLRLNSKAGLTGDLAGTSLAYAQSSETVPKLIFIYADHIPDRGNVYALDNGEVYRVDHTEPRDTLTITAICIRLTDEEAASYPPPEE
jgi:hypothetical protein